VRSPCFGAILLIAWVVSCSACVRNPATGERQLSLISHSQEMALGEQATQEVADTIGYYDDDSLARYVRRVGMALAQTSERPNLPWTFEVVDDPTTNAFALPGGHIFVTRGLLAHLENEAQLATVLGHEIGHVTAEHSLNQMSKQQLASVGIGLGGLVSGSVAALGQKGLSLLMLKFSRDDERQADTLGVRYALRAGYDPREMPKVFAVLERVSKRESHGKTLPTWLETHPDPEERIRTTNARLERLHRDFTGLKVAEEPLLGAIRGLVFGEDPRQGFFRGSRFFQPELGFTVTFPSGFETANTRQAVQAASPAGDAAMQLTLAPSDSPRQAMAAFREKSGVVLSSDSEQTEERVSASFTAGSGEVKGTLAFVRVGEHTFQVVGVATPAAYPKYERTFADVIASLAPVTDPSLLAEKPKRVQVERLDEPSSVLELQRKHPTLSVEELATVNQVPASARLERGTVVKWVAPSDDSSSASLSQR